MAEWDAVGADCVGDFSGGEADSAAGKFDGEAGGTAEDSDREAGSIAESSDGETAGTAEDSNGETADTAEVSSKEADSTTVFSDGETGKTEELPDGKAAGIEGIPEGESDSRAGNPDGETKGIAEVSVNGDLQASEDGQPDMPTDTLDAVVQTEKPVETFEEIDYVEGRWTNARHSEWAEKQENNNGLTATEITLLKAGATYADISGHNMKGEKKKYWHGRADSNYIANYIFVTKAALTGGNLEKFKLSDISGMRAKEFNNIKANMDTNMLFERTWKDIMNEIKSGYTGQKRWRQVFIYGLALHLATDAFAHSSYYKTANNTIKKYRHNKEENQGIYDPNYSADHINCTPNRWKYAYHTADWIAYNCYSKQEGDAYDFSSYGYPCWKGFYMGYIYTYAKQASPGYDTAILKQEFKSMNCIPPQGEL